jgi:hypothetical protein
LIGDCHRTFTLVFARGDIPADADLDQLAIFVDQYNVCLALLVAGFVALHEKAHVPGLRAQMFDEAVLSLAVFFRQLPDQHVTTILERFDPVFPSDFGIGFRGPIIMVFDSEHDAILQPSS